jgi:hypothetical protein
VRRTASLTIANPTGALSPQAPGDPFYPGEWVRIERGAVVNGLAMYVPLMTGVVGPFEADMSGTLTVPLADPLSLLAQPIGDTLVIAAGTPADVALRYLWEPVLGDGSGWHLDSGGRTVGTAYVTAEDDDRLGDGVTLMGDMGLEVFAYRDGVPVLRPVPDPTTLPVVASWQAAAAIMSDLARTGPSMLPPNRVVTIGTDASGAAIRGQADVTDPTSPFHASKIGLRVAPIYRSALMTTPDLCNAVALKWLWQYLLYQDSTAASKWPDPLIDAGDVVAMAEAISGTGATYWLSRVVTPVTTGAQQLAGPRVIPVLAL